MYIAMYIQPSSKHVKYIWSRESHALLGFLSPSTGSLISVYQRDAAELHPLISTLTSCFLPLHSLNSSSSIWFLLSSAYSRPSFNVLSNVPLPCIEQILYLLFITPFKHLYEKPSSIHLLSSHIYTYFFPLYLNYLS